MKNFYLKTLLIILFPVILSACGGSGDEYCQNVEPIPYSEQSIFINTSQAVTVVEQSNNLLALACHNCYQYKSSSINDTLLLISNAINADADLIELDVTLDKNSDDLFKIRHGSQSKGISFNELLQQPLLVNSEQLLFIELKDEIKHIETIRAFLRILKASINQNGQYAYMNNNRFVTLRNINDNSTLARFRTVLRDDEFIDIKPFVKLSRLLYKKIEPAMYQEITTVHQCGFNMIELDFRLGVDVIKRLNAYAESLGLAVNIFTIDETNVEEIVLALKHDVDIMTVENFNREKKESESLISYIKQLIN